MRLAFSKPISSASRISGVSISNCSIAVLAAVLPCPGGRRSISTVDSPRAVVASASSAPVIPAPTITTSTLMGASSLSMATGTWA